MSQIKTTDKQKRSMLGHYFTNKNANFTAVEDSVFVANLSEPEQEKADAANLSLIDLSTSERIGFKGADTPDWLKSLKIELPQEPNTSLKINEDTIVAKLSANEYLFLSYPGKTSEICNKLAKSWQLQPGRLCYRLERDHSHCCFAITGKYYPQMMAKLCGVDLSPEQFPLNHVAQTSVARTNSIVIHTKLNNIDSLILLSDSASAEYIYQCLLDAMIEFSGKEIGINAIIS